MLNDILWPDHIQRQPLTDQTLYRTRPFTEYWEVSIEHLRRVWHADRGRLLLRIPGPVPVGLAYVLFVETNPFPNLSLFYRTMLFECPSVLSRFCLCCMTRHLYLLFPFLIRKVSHKIETDLTIWQSKTILKKDSMMKKYWYVLKQIHVEASEKSWTILFSCRHSEMQWYYMSHLINKQINRTTWT